MSIHFRAFLVPPRDADFGYSIVIEVVEVHPEVVIQAGWDSPHVLARISLREPRPLPPCFDDDDSLTTGLAEDEDWRVDHGRHRDEEGHVRTQLIASGRINSVIAVDGFLRHGGV